MTVRIAKQPVNIREKLSELERPIGLNGSALMRTETPQEAFSLIGAGRRNLIINGSALISQRGTSAAGASATGGVVSCDQWKSFINGGSGSGAAFTLQQESSVVPNNFITSLKVNQTGATTLTGVNYNLIANYIEGYRIAHLGFGTSAAKTITLSFWIRSSITGTFGGALSNSAQDRSYPFQYTINSVNTWERKTITIPGDTTGTWIKDSGRGLELFFSLGTGPSYSGPAGAWAGATYLSATGVNNWVGQSSTFYITGVQLEEGKNATEFEHRSYGEELALCQRYYQEIGNGNNGANEIVEGGYGTTAMVIYNSIQLLVEMRTVPTLSQVGNIYTVNVSQPGSLSGHVGRKSFSISNTVTSAGTWVYATSTSAYFTLSAEL
jgi:hypothetical protein